MKLAWRYIESKEEAKEREQLEKEKEKTLAAGEEWVEPEKPSTFTYKFSTTGSVTPETKLYVEFDYPLVRFDSAAVVLTEQMEKEEPRPIRIRWQQDTANMRRWWLDVPWQLKNNYALTIPKGALADVAEQQNDRSQSITRVSIPRNSLRSSSMWSVKATRRATSCSC